MGITIGTVITAAGFSVLCAVLEFVLILGFEFAKTPRIKNRIGRVCAILIWILTILWAGLLVLRGMAAWDYLKVGDTASAIRLGITSILLLVGIYTLVLRYYLKKVRWKKKSA